MAASAVLADNDADDSKKNDEISTKTNDAAAASLTLPPPLKTTSPRPISRKPPKKGSQREAAVARPFVSSPCPADLTLTRNQRKKIYRKEREDAERKELSGLSEEQKKLKEYQQRIQLQADKDHLKARRRHDQRERARQKKEKEGKERFKVDKSAKERQKEAEKKRKDQQKEEAELKGRVEKLKMMKEKLLKMGGVEEAKELIEREMEEEEEEEEVEIEVEDNWQAIAAEFDVVLPAVKTQYPKPGQPKEVKRIKVTKEKKKERKREEREAHNAVDLITISAEIYGKQPEDDFSENDPRELMRLYDEADQEWTKIKEYRSLEAHPTHTPQQRAAMSHDDQNYLFSEVRPCKTKAEAEMLKRRWEEAIGPEVYQYYRSFGWRFPDWLEWGKVLKLQDKKMGKYLRQSRERPLWSFNQPIYLGFP